MEPEGSLPHSQVHATCPYPEPARSSPYPPTTHFLKIHLKIILPSNPRSSKWSLSLTLPHQNLVYASLIPHTCYMRRPSQFSRFYHPNNIGWGVQIRPDALRVLMGEAENGRKEDTTACKIPAVCEVRWGCCFRRGFGVFFYSYRNMTAQCLGTDSWYLPNTTHVFCS